MECPVKVAEICRLFILPEYPAKGYGNRLMDFLEDMVFQKYQVVHIDASFPAERMYLKREYWIKTYEKTKTGGGTFDYGNRAVWL